MFRQAPSYCLVLAALFIFKTPATAQSPYGFRHIATREAALHVVYDSFYQRFYGTVPGENAVYVMAEADGSVIQKVNVPSAYGLDLSVDGTRLYVSSNVTVLGEPSAQMIFVIDTTTLHIVNIIRPTASLSQNSAYLTDNVPSFLASLSDGKLAYAATDVGVTGGAVYLYDPTTGFSSVNTPIDYYSGILSKAAGGNGYVSVSGDSAGEQVSLYDTASATYTANVYFNTTNNGDVVMSPDGSMVLLGGHILCNRSLQEIADLAGAGQPTNLAWTSQGSSFSPDGTKIYVASSLNTTTTLPGGGTVSYSNPVVYIFNSSTHQLLNTLPLPEGSIAYQSGYGGVGGIAVGSSGKAMVIDNAGFLELDPTTAPATLPGAYTQNLAEPQPMSPDGGTLTSPQSTTFNGAGFRTGAQVYFGQTPVSTTYVSANVLSVQPPSGTAGLVDISVFFPDGWALLAPQAYSYGPVITDQNESAGGADGGTVVSLYGHGFDVTTGYPTVLVGGRSATVTASNATSVTFTTPPGAVGAADIQLTSMFGTTTVTGGFTYLTHQTIPSLLANEMVVDNARNQIYVADANTGSVFAVNATTLAATVLFAPASGGITSLAMTPDGSQLLAANAGACTLDIIDLATGKDLQTIVPTPGNQPGTLFPIKLVATARGTALVALVDSSLYDSGELVEVNLTTGATVIAQSNMFQGILLTSSADGTIVYIAVSAADGSSGAPPEMWTSASDSIVKRNVVGEYLLFDLSTTDLGDRVMDDCYTSDQADSWLRLATACAPDAQLPQGGDLVMGVRMHPSGSLGYVPTTKGVEIFDIHHGQTVVAIGDAAGSLEGADNLAISHDGSRLYIAEPNGVGVFTLPAVPLSIGSLTPSSGNAGGGQAVVLRGSGFSQGTTVTVDGNPAGVQFVDSTQLILTMPAVTPAEDVVTVTNPGGSTYSLDAAWNAIPVITTVPALNSITPVQAYTGGADTFTVNGSGFEPDSVGFLNGIAAMTQFLSPTQLNVTAAHLAGPGTDSIAVENPPSTTPSNAVSITVIDAVPYLNTLTPPSIPAGSESFQLTAFGNVTLAPDSVLQWNGTTLASQLIDSSHIVAAVPASLVASTGTASVTILSPHSAPGVSNAQTFAITPSVASMTISTSSHDLGPVLAGNTASGMFTITSTGAIPLTITKLASNNTNFSFSGCTSPLSQGQSCTATVVYTPLANSGLQGELATVTITSNASTQPNLTLEGFSGTLSFYPQSTQLSVKAGQSVTDSINVTSYGYTPALTAQLTCSNLPANTTCSFSPASFSMSAINGNGNGDANFTVTITTQAPTAASLRNPSLGRGLITLAAFVFLVRIPRRKLPKWHTCLGIFLLLGVSGCASGNAVGGSGGSTGGGGSSGSSGGGASLVSGTPAGTYSITVISTIPGMKPLTQVLTLNVM